MLIKNHILFGTIAGLIIPAIAMTLIYVIGFPGFKFIDFFRYGIAEGFLENLVSLCGLANLPLFYLFIRNSLYSSVRGVILATFLLVFIVIYLKFLI